MLTSEWPDSLKWLMRIIGALIIAVIIGYLTLKKDYPRTAAAFLLGYKSALATGVQANFGYTLQTRAEVVERLRLLKVPVEFPKNPTQDQGRAMVEYAQKIAGTFEGRDSPELAQAFLVGFKGFIKSNTPKFFPGFDLKSEARSAGLPENKKLHDQAYFRWLIDQSENEVSEYWQQGIGWVK